MRVGRPRPPHPPAGGSSSSPPAPQGPFRLQDLPFASRAYRPEQVLQLGGDFLLAQGLLTDDPAIVEVVEGIPPPLEPPGEGGRLFERPGSYLALRVTETKANLQGEEDAARGERGGHDPHAVVLPEGDLPVAFP